MPASKKPVGAVISRRVERMRRMNQRIIDVFRSMKPAFSKKEVHDLSNLIAQGGAQIEMANFDLEDGKLEDARDKLDKAKGFLMVSSRVIKRRPFTPREREGGELAKALSAYPDAMGVSVDVHDSVRGKKVHADSEKLERALLNMVRNAEDAAERDRSKIRVGFRATPEHFIIEAADTGRGMTPEQKAAFRDPNSRFTTKKVLPELHGIGKSVIGEVLGQHRGELEVEQNKPRGTIVRIKIPLKRPESHRR